ncbi:2-amino-4-hydroxy-6-hydroxymethyldihydropteridine diphosphokinase [Bacteroidales bacterium OttesenSCG-928-J19]|nr:2-amino-4-hydroxy-6-hydroxymethyldihydropteridine diphosphokinase [Bacteroidales bacterium OttesenSCG-928-J19]
MISYLALGTNLGDKELNLQQAINLIAERIGNLSAISSVYHSEPWGFESENSFLNMVLSVDTNLSPEELLHETQRIEKEMGRTQKSNGSYQDRIIDIDIILYGDLQYKSDQLEIPHPSYRERAFVMESLREILPEEN